jgi:hypothetical protein
MRGQHRSQSQSQVADLRVLKDSIVVKRFIGIVHNPNPSMGVNVLDDRWRSFIEGLGMVEGRCGSDVVSVPPYARLPWYL